MYRVIMLFLVLLMLPVPGLPAFAQDNCAPAAFRIGWPRTDFCNTLVDLNTILSGGPGKDGIPSIDNPVMETVEAAAAWLGERAPVIVVVIGDEARAYPQAVLMWHEIANDEIAGVPVAVTFCPLCNSSIVFDRRVDGEVLELGVSGNLRNSDMVMYDRNTESWWQQFTGEGIVGQYAGTLLDIIPSQVVGFAQFAERYPDGLVLSRETGAVRSYGRNPYSGYIRTGPYNFFVRETDERLRATEHVLATGTGEDAVAYPFEVLAQAGVINDEVGGQPVVALWQAGTASALDQATIDESVDIGTAALYDRRLADDRVLTFYLDADGIVRDEETDSAWNVFGEAETGELAGTVLRRLVAAPHFWFAWAAFYPQTRIYAP